LAAEGVDNFALAFVTPLGAEHNGRTHHDRASVTVVQGAYFTLPSPSPAPLNPPSPPPPPTRNWLVSVSPFAPLHTHNFFTSLFRFGKVGYGPRSLMMDQLPRGGRGAVYSRRL
jgi:hypothetical protein